MSQSKLKFLALIKPEGASMVDTKKCVKSLKRNIYGNKDTKKFLVGLQTFHNTRCTGRYTLFPIYNVGTTKLYFYYASGGKL